jgi:hypothetical protein
LDARARKRGEWTPHGLHSRAMWAMDDRQLRRLGFSRASRARARLYSPSKSRRRTKFFPPLYGRSRPRPAFSSRRWQGPSRCEAWRSHATVGIGCGSRALLFAMTSRDIAHANCIAPHRSIASR